MSIVENVKLQRDSFVLDIPKLEILDQGIHLIQGPSGSGKSTLLNVLLGLTEAKNYHWRMGDNDLALLPTAERRIGIVFQHLGLFPHMSGRDNIHFVAKARGKSSSQIETELASWAQMLSMSQFLDRSVRHISGGEKQRVAFVRAIMSDPRIIFLDEPFSNLDEGLKREGREILKTLKAKVNCPILMVSHDSDDRLLADEVTVIERGRVIVSS